MDRIDSLGGFISAENARTGKKKLSRKAPVRSAFTDAVDQASREEAESVVGAPQAGPGTDALESLLDEIHTLGEQLKELPTLDRVQQYKKAVRGFLQYVVHKSLGVEEHESRTNILNRKRFTLIKVVDQKLERLAAGVLGNQREQLDLLARVDEVQGLLVDLVR